MLSAQSALEFLGHISEELTSSIEDFRTEKKCGEIELNFHHGELASVEIVERFRPGSEVGSFSAGRCTSFAAHKVSWFMHQKRSGRVSLMFDSGDLYSVNSYLRLAPGKKNGNGG